VVAASFRREVDGRLSSRRISGPQIARIKECIVFNHRWAAVSGIVFVVLMLVGASFIIDLPKPNAPAQEIAAYLADPANQMRNVIGAYMWVVGGLAFLGFVGGLRAVLRQAEGGPGTLSNLVFGAGVVFTAVWSVSAATLAAVAFSVGFSGAPLSDPDLVRVLPQLGSLLLLLGGGFAGIFLLMATSLIIVRTRVLPGWLAWFGLLIAITLVVPVWTYMNIVPLLVWVASASVVLFRRRTESSIAAAATNQSDGASAPVAAL
jgi:hypothetical protein